MSKAHWPKQHILMHCLGLWYVLFPFFVFFITNSCHLSQRCDAPATATSDNPHPKQHHPPAPSMMQCDVMHDDNPHLKPHHPPALTHTHMYGLFFSFFITNSCHLSQQHDAT